MENKNKMGQGERIDPWDISLVFRNSLEEKPAAIEQPGWLATSHLPLWRCVRGNEQLGLREKPSMHTDIKERGEKKKQRKIKGGST